MIECENEKVNEKKEEWKSPPEWDAKIEETNALNREIAEKEFQELENKRIVKELIEKNNKPKTDFLKIIDDFKSTKDLEKLKQEINSKSDP